jgi:hypothetical protein
MKTGRITYNFVIIFALLLLFACRPAAVSKEKSQNKDNKTETSLFDPLELPSDTTIVPKANPQQGDLIGKPVITDSQSNEKQDSLFNNLIESVDTLNSQSFRIQLFSSKVYGTGKQAFKVAEEIFDRPVYLDYEVPYYKVRVGNFANRDEAEKYLLKVRTTGYNDAWVVAVNINIRESERLYQDNLLQIEPE